MLPSVKKIIFKSRTSNIFRNFANLGKSLFAKIRINKIHNIQFHGIGVIACFEAYREDSVLDYDRLQFVLWS